MDSRFKAVDAAAIRAEMERLGELVREGGRLRLLCWCAPKRCHADAIADKILELARRQDASNQVAMITRRKYTQLRLVSRADRKQLSLLRAQKS